MSLPHHPFYCEENVYRLCEHERLGGMEKRAVFIANDGGLVALCHQRIGGEERLLVGWDYHVILLARAEGEEAGDAGWEVWDLGSTLGAPLPVERYLRQTFEELPLRDEFAPRFRVVTARDLVETFVSDRSHMRRRNGSFQRPPPPWPTIGPPGAPSNLARFVDTRAPFVGEVMDLAGLRARIAAGTL